MIHPRPSLRRTTWIAPPALALAALVASAACGPRPEPGAHATTSGVPDPAREALVRALQPRLPAPLRAMVRDSLRVHITPSAVIPSFRYHWGEWAPRGSDSIYRAVAVTAAGEAHAVRNAHEWSFAVVRIAWSPATPRQAAVACAEAARATGIDPREDADLYLGPRTLQGWRIDPSVDIHRLRPPEVTRVGGAFNRWRVDVWMGEDGVARRYRCVFTPRTGRRGPLAEFERIDSIAGIGLPARP